MGDVVIGSDTLIGLSVCDTCPDRGNIPSSKYRVPIQVACLISTSRQSTFDGILIIRSLIARNKMCWIIAPSKITCVTQESRNFFQRNTVRKCIGYPMRPDIVTLTLGFN